MAESVEGIVAAGASKTAVGEKEEGAVGLWWRWSKWCEERAARDEREEM
jgi:hypothetical protein